MIKLFMKKKKMKKKDLFKNLKKKKENETTSTLSDQISKDLKKKGMSFVGSITIYSYLEAIGIYNHHDRNCFLHL